MIEHSVLIYSKNQVAFIRECLESVLQQSLPADEIIVYDGGSSDGTLDVLRRYSGEIHLIEGPADLRPAHLAEAHAVHQAFAASHGEVLFLLDGDDRFKPDKIERYVAAFKAYPDASVVQAPLDRIDPGGISLGAALDPRYHITNHLREIYRQQDLNFFYSTSALAFSRSYLERVLPLDLADGRPLWTDVRLCLPAVYYGRIVTLSDPLSDWRVHAASDRDRSASGKLQVRQTFLRAEAFNGFCRRHRLRQISPWRNPRLYRQLARCAVPAVVVEFYHQRLQPLLDYFS